MELADRFPVSIVGSIPSRMWLALATSQGWINPSLANSITNFANDFRYWVIILLLPWLYFAWSGALKEIRLNNQIVSLRNDEHSITQVLDRFVLPRQLSKGQIESIGSFLQNFQPQEVSFELVNGDQEADTYQNDLQRALEKAGWHIKEVKSVPETSQSLSIDFRQTPEHSQVQSDFKHPKADLLLQEAFGLAGVRLDGVSSGSSPKSTEDVMTIIVGHRRRDSYVQPCEAQ